MKRKIIILEEETHLIIVSVIGFPSCLKLHQVILLFQGNGNSVQIKIYKLLNTSIYILMKYIRYIKLGFFVFFK